jgi:glutamyl-tRNA synthetase
MTVVTRFAPSPTGYLHIGGARTALFNLLFAKRHAGTYLLRVEDTDIERSTQAAIDAIHDGLNWLGLNADQPPLLQSTRAGRHVEVAHALVASGRAFYCYVSQQELDARRQAGESARATLRSLKESGSSEKDIRDAEMEVSRLMAAFRSPYRDGAKPASLDLPYTVRLRMPESGHVLNDDLVQGRVEIPYATLDDLVLLRADGTPTYMLAVVVDDHDMGITHVIRGDDHLTNAARQIPIFEAAGWTIPRFAHVPMIHGDDGAKLSKRHGALAVQAYRDMGYLPEALSAYLMRLGWSPGSDEILTVEEAAKIFDVSQIGVSPSRLDLKKLDSVNAHFMTLVPDNRLFSLAEGAQDFLSNVSDVTAFRAQVRTSIPILKSRAATIAELVKAVEFLKPLPDVADRPQIPEPGVGFLPGLLAHLTGAEWSLEALSASLKAFGEANGVGMGKFGPALRSALTAGRPSPDLGQTLFCLGRAEALSRLQQSVASAAPASK